jgi:hypothetical protein
MKSRCTWTRWVTAPHRPIDSVPNVKTGRMALGCAGVPFPGIAP